MVPDTILAVGDVVKIHNWHGVVLETHFAENGDLSIIRVQTIRNLFRGYGPEYIDVRLQPEAVQQGTMIELRREIDTHQRLLEGAVARLLETAVTADFAPVAPPPLPVAAD